MSAGKDSGLPLTTTPRSMSQQSSIPKVCFLIPSYHPLIGGAELQTQNLAKWLHDRGAETFVVTRRLPGTKPMEVMERVPVYRTWYRGHTASFLLSALRALIRMRGEYDIIQVQTYHSPVLIALLIKKLLGKPVVMKARHSDLISQLSRSGRHFLSRQRWGWTLQNVSAVIASNSFIRNQLVDAGLSPEKIALIPNAVDIEFFKPCQRKQDLRKILALPVGIPMAVYVGRLTRVKNVHILLKAWKCYVADGQDAFLVIVGDGAERAALETQARALNIQDTVRFVGEVAQRQVLPYLQASDVFVFASTGEGISGALLEAMAVGLVPVASRIPANEDVIEEGKNGLFFEVGDAQGLAEQLPRAFEESRRGEMGQAARARIVRRFSLDRIAADHLQLWRDLLQI